MSRDDKCLDTPLAKPVREIPAGNIASLRRQARDCHTCALWKHATQTVFGAGPDDARIMMIGEQPGLQEDQLGLPFVGPSGGALDRALAESGLDRARLYLTNTVKHFKFEQRGWSVAGVAAGIMGLATWHPSAILRAPDKQRREELYRQLVQDLSGIRTQSRAGARSTR